jgi:hypothetical protein
MQTAGEAPCGRPGGAVRPRAHGRVAGLPQGRWLDEGLWRMSNRQKASVSASLRRPANRIPFRFPGGRGRPPSRGGCPRRTARSGADLPSVRRRPRSRGYTRVAAASRRCSGRLFSHMQRRDAAATLKHTGFHAAFQLRCAARGERQADRPPPFAPGLSSRTPLGCRTNDRPTPIHQCPINNQQSTINNAHCPQK